jgi:hypothetical protein
VGRSSSVIASSATGRRFDSCPGLRAPVAQWQSSSGLHPMTTAAITSPRAGEGPVISPTQESRRLESLPGRCRISARPSPHDRGDPWQLRAGVVRFSVERPAPAGRRGVRNPPGTSSR